MPILIPNRLTKDLRATPGEARVFEALGTHLSKYWYAWFDLGLGNSEVYPDFTLVHPEHGLLVLEVKDSRIGDFVELKKDRFRTQSRSYLNPVVQPPVAVQTDRYNDAVDEGDLGLLDDLGHDSIRGF